MFSDAAVVAGLSFPFSDSFLCDVVSSFLSRRCRSWVRASSGLLLFFGSYDLRFRHPWRSYAVMIRFDWFFVIAGITLPVLVFPVSSFRLVWPISAGPPRRSSCVSSVPKVH